MRKNKQKEKASKKRHKNRRINKKYELIVGSIQFLNIAGEDTCKWNEDECTEEKGKQEKAEK